jgi:hypothetical protein
MSLMLAGVVTNAECFGRLSYTNPLNLTSSMLPKFLNNESLSREERSFRLQLYEIHKLGDEVSILRIIVFVPFSQVIPHELGSICC